MLLVAALLAAQTSGGGSADPAIAVDPAVEAVAAAPPVAPVSHPAASGETGVQWSALFRQSASFLALEEGFRAVTEEGARHSHEPFFGGWGASIGNLHGWADGDPFLVNYVGHPMQGAVSGFIWIQNDPRFHQVEFGRNREYWKSRLRAAAFALIYSEEEEIGPLSEASFGATQSYFPQQGFVDHVITPTVGLGWILAEDALDKYLIKRIDASGVNRYLKVLVRGGLNPSRSLANMLAGRVPWDRVTRPGFFSSPSPGRYVKESADPPRQSAGEAIAAPFEFSTMALVQKSSAGDGACVGGGADAAFRWAVQWQLILEVAGCKMTGLGQNVSGDSLQYLIGPRWTPVPTARWSPYAELLVGGQKTSYETFFPAAKAALVQSLQAKGETLQPPDHALYTSGTQSNAFAFKAGAGLDLKLNDALAVRMVGVGYDYSTAHGKQIQATSGLVLRFGTW